MTAPALELDEVHKRFGAAMALDGASARVRPGTVHAVLGENGAGKSTLMRVAFGLVRPDGGTIRVNGVVRRFASPADAIRAGLGMVHQHFSLVPAMTVAENVALGGRGRYDGRRAAALVRRVSEEIGLAVDPEARVGSLGVGAQQRVEIVKTLSRDARVLILDEPTAVLAPDEAADLLAWLRRFADNGRSAVIITHKLREALAVADDVTVLRRGRMGWVRRTGETTGLLEAFDVRASGPGVRARSLSGGNQQKLVLARELWGEVCAIVVENPSRGLDIRATADVHRWLREARDAGAAVVVYSGDLDEVLLLADRVVVVHAGELRETARDRDEVGRAMLGL